MSNGLGILVFEFSEDRDLYQALFPHWAESFSLVSLSEWLNSPVTRADFLGAFENRDWAESIEALRLAQLMTPEDAEFAFSELPQSKKLSELRRHYLAYLKTETAQKDLAATGWRLWESLKSSEPFTFSQTRLTFLKTRPPSRLFLELAEVLSIRPEIEESRCVFPSELFSGENGRIHSGVCISGPPARCLDRIAKKIRQWVERGVPAEDICISVSTHGAAVDALLYQLDAFSIPWQMHEQQKQPLAPLSPLETLRLNTGLDISERLELNRGLLKKQRQSLQRASAELVENSPVSNEISEPKKNGIHILPARHYPFVTAKKWIGFLDASEPVQERRLELLRSLKLNGSKRPDFSFKARSTILLGSRNGGARGFPPLPIRVFYLMPAPLKKSGATR